MPRAIVYMYPIACSLHGPTSNTATDHFPLLSRSHGQISMDIGDDNYWSSLIPPYSVLPSSLRIEYVGQPKKFYREKTSSLTFFQ